MHSVRTFRKLVCENLQNLKFAHFKIGVSIAAIKRGKKPSLLLIWVLCLPFPLQPTSMWFVPFHFVIGSWPKSVGKYNSANKVHQTVHVGGSTNEIISFLILTHRWGVCVICVQSSAELIQRITRFIDKNWKRFTNCKNWNCLVSCSRMLCVWEHEIKLKTSIDHTLRLARRAIQK